MIDTARSMKTTPENVTRVSSQLHVKETMMEAIIKELYSTKTPSFSEIPSWRILLVEVMVPTAYPGGKISRSC